MKMEHNCEKENKWLSKQIKLDKDEAPHFNYENTCKFCLWLNDVEHIDTNGTAPEYYTRFRIVPDYSVLSSKF